MTFLGAMTLDEKLKLISVEQQNCINGYIDGLIEARKQETMLPASFPKSSEHSVKQYEKMALFL